MRRIFALPNVFKPILSTVNPMTTTAAPHSVYASPIILESNAFIPNHKTIAQDQETFWYQKTHDNILALFSAKGSSSVAVRIISTPAPSIPNQSLSPTPYVPISQSITSSRSQQPNPIPSPSETQQQTDSMLKSLANESKRKPNTKPGSKKSVRPHDLICDTHEPRKHALLLLHHLFQVIREIWRWF